MEVNMKYRHHTFERHQYELTETEARKIELELTTAIVRNIEERGIFHLEDAKRYHELVEFIRKNGGENDRC